MKGKLIASTLLMSAHSPVARVSGEPWILLAKSGSAMSMEIGAARCPGALDRGDAYLDVFMTAPSAGICSWGK